MNRRILFLTTFLAYGGAEVQVAQLAMRLQARGWRVDVVSMRKPQALTDELERAGVSVQTLGMRKGSPDPRAIFRLARIIRQRRIEIVHSHMVHANLLARATRPLVPGRIWLCTAHSIDEGGGNRERAYRLTDPLCDLTTQVSRAGLERYVAVKAAPRRKIHYLPNGVDCQKFRPQKEVRARLRRELGVGNAFLWLAVGRLDPAKDYPTMLRAFAAVRRSKPEALLFIAGQGRLRPELNNLVHQLHLEDSVQFLGVREDVPALMNAADAFVMSSAWEGLPMVLLEAAATALPVVATDVGGVGEIIDDGRTGHLVPPERPDALAEAMLRVMALSEDERREMGDAGRARIEAVYSLERVVSQWETLYRQLLSRERTDR